jgi:hypothetical protein
MRLNIPIVDELAACRSLLIAGMGGGFDVFCGLPLYFELRQRGVNVHLANLTFSQTGFLKEEVRLSEGLVGVSGESKSLVQYFPELHLAHWFQEARGEDITIWCFPRAGVEPLLEAYQRLAEHLSLDGILLVDGGVDSLMRGDEHQLGTILEDAYSLAAVDALENIPLKRLACLGFGAEDDVSHTHVLQNIAALTEEEAFLGACALVRQMESYQQYEAALEYAHSRPRQDPSVINASIVSAVQGNYGNYHLTDKTKGSRLWISPFMPLYWFFDLPAVAARCLLLPELRRSRSNAEALAALVRCRNILPQRPAARIPLA